MEIFLRILRIVLLVGYIVSIVYGILTLYRGIMQEDHAAFKKGMRKTLLIGLLAGFLFLMQYLLSKAVQPV